MSIQIQRDLSAKMRHTVRVGTHSFSVDEPPANGGEDLGPTPHDLYDSALGACKALTTLWYARRRQIPLEDIGITVERDDSQERQGTYRLRVTLQLGGALSDRVPGLGGGGALRLSVDLAWLAVAGCVAAALLARVAASARRVHVLAFFAIYFGAALYAVVTAWQVFPRWFLLAVLLPVPLQAGFGMRLARPRR